MDAKEKPYGTTTARPSRKTIDRETVEQVLALDVDKYKYGFVTEIEVRRCRPWA
jgi:hypothetical protein